MTRSSSMAARSAAASDRALARVRATLAYIRDHPDADCSLSALAKRAGAAPRHLHRLVRALTGTTLHAHVRGLRLDQAATRLASSDDPILRVALDAGFASQASFTRAFASRHQCPPRAYRERSRAASPAPTGGPRAAAVAIPLVKVPVRDFARARAFYRDGLGLAEEFAVDAYGWAQYETATVPLCLYVVGMGGGGGVPGHELGFHLAVRDARALHRRCQARGLDIACGCTASDDGGSFFIVRDPDGNTLKIVQGR